MHNFLMCFWPQNKHISVCGQFQAFLTAVVFTTKFGTNGHLQNEVFKIYTAISVEGMNTILGSIFEMTCPKKCYEAAVVVAGLVQGLVA